MGVATMGNGRGREVRVGEGTEIADLHPRTVTHTHTHTLTHISVL